MKNNLGIHYGCFVKNWGEDEFPLLGRVKSLGFDLFEIGAPWLMEQSDTNIGRFQEEAVTQGLELAVSLGLSGAQDISSNDADVRKEGLRVLTGLARAMAKVGAGMCSGIVHGAWNGKIDDYDEKPGRWENSVRTMKEACRIFGEEGVIFNVEVVNRFENFLINDCAEALKYLKDVGSPSLGVHLDTFHMNIEEDSMVGSIMLAGKNLKHFHVGENNRKFPGQGNLPWKEVFAALAASDYCGPVVMEPFVTPGGEVGSAISLFRDLVDLNQCEQMIRSSVDFIRSLMGKNGDD